MGHRKDIRVMGVFAFLTLLAGGPAGAQLCTPLGPEFRIHTQLTGDQNKPIVVADGSTRFAVAWNDLHTNQSVIRFIAPDGNLPERRNRPWPTVHRGSRFRRERRLRD